MQDDARGTLAKHLEDAFVSSNEALKVLAIFTEKLRVDEKDDDFDEAVAASKELLAIERKIEELQERIAAWS